MLNEIEIKNLLKNNISKTQSPIYYISKKDNTTVVVDELCVNNGIARADVVAINGKLHCFEIKSDFDTFKRLDNQLINYLKIFDEISLITTQSHIDKLDNLPDCIGVYQIKGNRFEVIKKPTLNSNTDIYSLFCILWRPEVNYVSKMLNIKNYYKISFNDLCDKILSNINEDQLKFYIRAILKLRAKIMNWKSNHTKELYDEYVRFLSTQPNFQ